MDLANKSSALQGPILRMHEHSKDINTGLEKGHQYMTWLLYIATTYLSTAFFLVFKIK
jgi:hypothetical protein